MLSPFAITASERLAKTVITMGSLISGESLWLVLFELLSSFPSVIRRLISLPFSHKPSFFESLSFLVYCYCCGLLSEHRARHSFYQQ